MEVMTDTTLQQERTNAAIDVTSRAWRAAFTAQLTNELTDTVLAYASQRAKWIARKLGKQDPQLAEELTQDALGDTWAGVCKWNPDDLPLAVHLTGVIRGRTARMMEHDEKFRGELMTADDLGLESEVSAALDAERTGSASDLSTHVDETIGALRALAADDSEVLALLDAYGRGAIDRREVMRVTGMASKTYHNAVRRMLRLVERLPAETREAAIRAMV